MLMTLFSCDKIKIVLTKVSFSSVFILPKQFLKHISWQQVSHQYLSIQGNKRIFVANFFLFYKDKTRVKVN